jgi:predicted small secreted protein
MKRLILILGAAVISFSFLGCGETVRGVGKDGSRVVKGIKTIFVSDSAEKTSWGKR